MTKALLCTINSAHVGPYSGIQKLFGDPDGYAYKLDNRTFVDTLPIHMNGLRVQIYDFFHSISIDYGTQRVHYGNNFRKRLEYGLYVYSNSTTNYDYDAVPETNQVCPRPTFYSKPNEQYGFYDNLQFAMFAINRRSSSMSRIIVIAEMRMTVMTPTITIF